MPVAVWGNMLVPVARAQIAPDGSLPTEVVRDGNNFTINGGQSAGSNLFHSFQEFSVPANGEAFFNNNLDVENIFSRVTGGNISNIDGLIRANGSANLFLLNPAGIVFGPNARLNIGGSFLGSTASGLLFPNGQEFRAINQPEPLLTINAPIGLWFRGNEGNIVNESVVLGVNPGERLGLVGGNVSVNGGIIETLGGRVELGGLAAAGTIGLNNDGSLSFPEGVARGNVEFANFTGVNVRGEGGGTVTVNANDVNIAGGSLLVTGIGPGLGSTDAGAGNITIDATGEIAIDEQSGIFNQVGEQAIGDTGNIEIKGRSVSITNGAVLEASNLGEGNVGNVKITATEGISLETSAVLNQVMAGAIGDTGNIEIEGRSLSLSNGAELNNGNFGQGNAGNVTIDATGAIAIDEQSAVVNQVGVGAIWNAGNIQINGRSVSLSNGAQLINSNLGQGNAGNVTINVDSLELTSGGQIITPAFNGESPGSTTVNAATSISILGGDPNLGPSGIFADVQLGSTGNGNELSIETGSLLVADGAQVSASTSGMGDGGNLSVNTTESVELSGVGSGIFAQVRPGATGNGGDLALSTGKLIVEDGAEVSINTLGEGNAGSLNISATESVEVSGIGSGLFTDVSLEITPDGIVLAPEPATGSGGDLTLSTGQLIVKEGASISSSTAGEGNAGNLTINATESVQLSGSGSSLLTDVVSGMTASGEILPTIGNGSNLQISTAQLIIEDGAVISANTTGKGNAGNVTISNAQLVELRGDGAVITANTFGEGNAGNLTISNAELVKLSGEGSGLFTQVLGVTAADETIVPAIGNGGELNISTNRLIVEDGSSISASTFGAGDAGNLTINAPESVTVSSGNSGLFAQVNSEATGNGGLLQITTGELLVQEEAGVSARTIGRGNANNLIIKTDRLLVRSGGQISASTFGPGNAGNLTVNASELIELTGTAPAGSSGIFSNAIEGTGNGGNLEIGTEELIIQDGASIGVSNFQSQNLRPPGSGNPGNINIQAGSVLLNDGNITAATAAGDRGNIRVNSQDSTRLQNGSEISASTRTGIGGNVIVNAGNSVIINESRLTVRSTETGTAGNITVNAREMRFNRGTLDAETAAARGNINLTTSGNIELRNNSAIATDAREDATGGNIEIETDFLIAYPGNNDITANANRGDGGQIEITAEAILGIAERDAQTGGNDITVSSTFGRSGEIIFNIPDVESLQGRVEPSDNPVEVDEEIAQACRPDPEGESNSFTIIGRGGVPRGPQDPLTSDTMRVGGKPASQTAETRPPIVTLVEDAEPISPEDIVLARGWIVHEDGIVELTAYPTPYTSDRPFPHPVRCPRNRK